MNWRCHSCWAESNDARRNAASARVAPADAGSGAPLSGIARVIFCASSLSIGERGAAEGRSLVVVVAATDAVVAVVPDPDESDPHPATPTAASRSRTVAIRMPARSRATE